MSTQEDSRDAESLNIMRTKVWDTCRDIFVISLLVIIVVTCVGLYLYFVQYSIEYVYLLISNIISSSSDSSVTAKCDGNCKLGFVMSGFILYILLIVIIVELVARYIIYKNIVLNERIDNHDLNQVRWNICDTYVIPCFWFLTILISLVIFLLYSFITVIINYANNKDKICNDSCIISMVLLGCISLAIITIVLIMAIMEAITRIAHYLNF
jgi:hypothetical protein